MIKGKGSKIRGDVSFIPKFTNDWTVQSIAGSSLDLSDRVIIVGDELYDDSSFCCLFFPHHSCCIITRNGHI